MELLKEKVRLASISAEEQGLCKHKTGNFSMADQENKLFVISPSGLDKKSLTNEDFPIITFDGEIESIKEGVHPSREHNLHAMIYKSRPDVSAIVHTHSPFATSFAILGKPIKPVTFEATFYGVDTPVTKSILIPGSNELAEEVAATIMNSDVCLIRNHGVVVVGKDIEETLLKASYVEAVAKMYYLTLTMQNDDGFADITGPDRTQPA